ncbi:deoxyribonuclease V [Celerinatantimonas sp. YJH-8]|uniref:deoxyribonuclease V n=1 Tax=Celerinatantimonas sp. YJH-8 TaxID=3228714 RepID=UPI0038CAF16A
MNQWQWPFSVAEAKQWQHQQSLLLDHSPSDVKPQWIGGADIGLINQGKQVRAAICVFDAQSLAPYVAVIAVCDNQMPYIPGLLAFREVPALVQAWRSLPVKPDLLLVDGQGIAHPRGFGNAAQLGLELNCSSIGVAKSRLFGQHPPLTASLLQAQPLTAQQRQIGWVIRTKARCNPLYISPGHRISLEQSLYWSCYCLDGYRLPKPTRYADILASARRNQAQISAQFVKGVINSS